MRKFLQEILQLMYPKMSEKKQKIYWEANIIALTLILRLLAIGIWAFAIKQVISLF